MRQGFEMEVCLSLFEGHAFLGSRGVAHRLRSEAERLLRADPETIVTLDCAGIEGLSHSFSDELLSSLSDLLGSDVSRRVILTNCTSSVYADLMSVADMHHLFMPAIGSGCGAELADSSFCPA